MHICFLSDKFKSKCCAPLIDECEEMENGELWVTNVEYCNQVNFCPFCGYKAKI